MKNIIETIKNNRVTILKRGIMIGVIGAGLKAIHDIAQTHNIDEDDCDVDAVDDEDEGSEEE